MALSMDIREKVRKAIEGGTSRRQAAARFDIGPVIAVRWAKRVEIAGRQPQIAANRGSRRFHDRT